jgi:hypothetical protein
MIRSPLLIAFAVALLGTGSARAENSDFKIPETEIILQMQDAVRKDDKHWFADHLHLPVRYYGKTAMLIRSKRWFLKHYSTIIGAELKASLLAQHPEKYLKNYQGLMVGDGGLNIWLEEFGDPGAGIPSDYEIITINNAPNPPRHDQR